jgi:hypothetical protein
VALGSTCDASLVYDDDRTGTPIDVFEWHALRGHNQVNSSSEKNCSASSGTVLGAQTIGSAMQDVHDNNQDTENQKDRQQ